MPVNISGRVSTSLTGRRAWRAAITASTTCGQTRSPAPKPPPTYGASTRTPSSGTPNIRASAARTWVGHWVESCTVSRSPSQAASVVNRPSGLLVFSAVVYAASTTTSARASPAAGSPQEASLPHGSATRSARGSSRSSSGSARS